MTTQMQHAVRVQMMVDQFMQDNEARGYNVRLQKFLEEDCGYKFLGGGYFSIVVRHPENPDLVIKVNVGCGEGEGFTEGPCGDGYMDFVAACMRAPKSKHLPEFHAAVVGKKCAVVIMRRYRSYNAFDLPYEQRRAASDVIDLFNGGRSLHDPGIMYVLDVMGPASDLHGANYMWDDSNDCIVITDPYTFRAPGPRDRVERYLDNGKVVVDVQVQRIEEQPAVAYGAEALKDFNAFAQMFNVDAILEMVIRGNRFAHRGPNIQNLPMDDGALDAMRHIREAAMKADLIPAPFVVHKARKVECPHDRWLLENIKEVTDERAKVVADCEKPSLWGQEKDHVLYLRSKYDRPAQPVRVQGTLLSRQDTRGLCTARTIKHGAVGRKAGGIILDTRGALEWTPERLYVQDTGTQHDVAA